MGQGSRRRLHQRQRQAGPGAKGRGQQTVRPCAAGRQAGGGRKPTVPHLPVGLLVSQNAQVAGKATSPANSSMAVEAAPSASSRDSPALGAPLAVRGQSAAGAAAAGCQVASLAPTRTHASKAGWRRRRCLLPPCPHARPRERSCGEAGRRRSLLPLLPPAPVPAHAPVEIHQGPEKHWSRGRACTQVLGSTSYSGPVQVRGLPPGPPAGSQTSGRTKACAGVGQGGRWAAQVGTA